MFPLLKQSLCVYVSAADKPAGINRFEDLAEAFGSHFLLFIRVEITVYVQIACVRFEAHVRFVCFIRKETFFFSLLRCCLFLPSLRLPSLCFYFLSHLFVCVYVSPAVEKLSLCVYVSAPDNPAGINRFKALAEAFG